MSISVDFDERSDADLHGLQVKKTGLDFYDKKSLKKAVKSLPDEFECLQCGGRETKGRSVIAEIQRFHLYQLISGKGFFGKKLVDVKQKSVYRINTIYLKPSGFLQSAGYLKCASCGWQEKAGMSITVAVVRGHDGKPAKNVAVSVVFGGAFSGSVQGRTNFAGSITFDSKPNRKGHIVAMGKKVFKGKILAVMTVSV